MTWLRRFVLALWVAALSLPALAQAPADLPLADDLRDQMAGRYALTMGGADAPAMALRLFVAEGALMGAINDNDPSRMLYQGDQSFRPSDAPVVLVTVAEMDGVVTRLTIETPDGSFVGVRTGDAEDDPATSGALFDALRAADRRLFETIFVACDADAAVAMLDDDVEFYHDKVGRSLGEEVHTAIRNQATSCPREQGLTRVVDEASLYVSPIPGFGAVQTGTHRFVQAEGVTVARFTHVWHETPDGWRVHRAVSYDHRPEAL